MASTPLVRAVFAALVLATAGAFFVTQRLKGEQPVVLRFSTRPPAFSPNGDGVRDYTNVGFDLSKATRVTFDVTDEKGNRVRRFVHDQRLPGDHKYRYRWDGRDDRGRKLPDGSYRLRLTRPDEGRILNSLKEVRIDTTPPGVVLTSTHPNVISTDQPQAIHPVRVRYRGPRNNAPEFRLFRTDGGRVRVVARLRGDDSYSMLWHGFVRGRPAAPGNYAVSVRVRDPAGNSAQFPATPTPTAADARAGTGIVVSNLALTAPAEPVRAGAQVTFAVGPRPRALRWELTRVGLRRAAATGRLRQPAASLRVRVPSGAHSGLYVLRATGPGGLTALAPLAVTGRGRVLVVLPTLSWQGSNPVDDDHDGFGDTLDDATSVPAARPYLGSGLPPDARRVAVPLLEFLDRARLRYTVTTDAALAQGHGPRLEDASGVAVAGSARWLPAALGGRLRRYVTGGGALVSFGEDAFRRTLRLGGGRLTRVGGAAARDVFGERTDRFATVSAPLRLERDDLGLFSGVGPLFGSFAHFERSRGLGPGARLVAAAGRDPGSPAFVAYRLGRGLVVRTGTADWAGELADRRLDDQVQRVTRRIWRTVLGG